MAKAFCQECPKPCLNLAGRREIRVSAFRGASDIALPTPYQESLAQPGARRQNRDRAILHSLAGINLNRLTGPSDGRRICYGPQIVQQADAL